MQPIDLYWFSGTGNTLLIVQRLAEVFRAEKVPVTLIAIDKANPAAVNPEHMLGLAFPVAAFSTYPLVWRFIEALPDTQGTPVFMVDTMGRFSGFMVGALKQLLQSKGYTPLAACEIVMPGNYLSGVKPREECEAKIVKGLAKAGMYAHEILSGRARWYRNSPLPYSWIRRIWQTVEKSFAKEGIKFQVSAESCNRCGLCMELCPVGNIVMADAVPGYLDHCQQCQRCIAFCPTSAISAPGGHSSGRYRAVSAQSLRAGLKQSSG